MRLVFCLVLSVIIGSATAGGLFECNVKEDCAASTATCVNNVCKCPVSQVLNNDGTKCLAYTKVIMGACETNSQCDTFGGAVACIDKKCQCQDGYVYLRRHCIKRLGNLATCTTNDECFDGFDYHSRVCVANKCQCAAGYYDRVGFDCRPKIALGAACSLNIDCQDEGAVCKVRKCVLQDANPTEKQEVSAVQVPDDDIIDEIATVDIIPKAEGILLNSVCSPGDTCSDSNAICSPITQTCICRNGFFEKSKKCTAELGSSCQDKSDCPMLGAVCDRNICNCVINKNYDVTNQKCRATANQLEDKLNCATDDSCRVLTKHFYCDVDEKYCRCEKGYKINDDFICEISCVVDKDCPTEHQICDPTFNKCVCAPAYKDDSGVCKPKIDGACANTEQCTEVVANSQCTKGKCVCNAKYVKYDYNCYPEKPIGKECMYNEQCAWKYNSTCAKSTSSDKKFCTCDPGFINVNGDCYRIATRVGDYCTHPAVCMADSICEKSKCTCTSGLAPSKDKLRCTAKTNDDGSPAAAGRLAASVTSFLSVGVITVVLLVGDFNL